MLSWVAKHSAKWLGRMGETQKPVLIHTLICLNYKQLDSTVFLTTSLRLTKELDVPGHWNVARNCVSWYCKQSFCALPHTGVWAMVKWHVHTLWRIYCRLFYSVYINKYKYVGKYITIVLLTKVKQRKIKQKKWIWENIWMEFGNKFKQRPYTRIK